VLIARRSLGMSAVARRRSPLRCVMVSAENDKRLERRVARAAEEALAERRLVSPIDVLCGLGWLHPSNVERWRRGRPERLEDVVFIEPWKIETAVGLLQAWARERGLEPSERSYPARSRTPRELRFSAGGDSELERAYKTHWLSPQFGDAERARLDRREGRRPDLVVIQPLGEFTCAACGTQRTGLLMMEDPGSICMACADMDHLLFLPSGDAALTRRARAASGLSAVVVRFSRARRRYERQGILVEEQALESAEAECLADEQARARRREREASRRAEEDRDLQQRMADEIRRLFPGCPPERAREIAGHTAARGSGRVGRSSAGPRARTRRDRARGPRLGAPPRHPLRRAADVRRRPPHRPCTGRRRGREQAAGVAHCAPRPPSPHSRGATGLARSRRAAAAPPG
jgi:hypothetical protein